MTKVETGQNNLPAKTLVIPNVKKTALILLYMLMKGIMFYLLALKFFRVVLSELLFSAPTKLINVSQDQTIREGSNLQLFCEASGKPVPNITWTIGLRNGSESEILHNGSTWSMLNVTRANSGTYRCLAHNGVGNAVAFVVNINVTCKRN